MSSIWRFHCIHTHIHTHHFESSGNGCYDIIVGAPLQAREHGAINLLLVVVHDLLALDHALHTSAVEDESRARAAQGLVGGRRDDVSMVKWTGVQLKRKGVWLGREKGAWLVGPYPHSNEAADVSHICHKQRSHIVTNLYNIAHDIMMTSWSISGLTSLKRG